MTRDGGSIDSVVTDRIYAAVALAAALFGIPQASTVPWTLGLLLVALVPWALVVLRREPPLWLFAVLAIAPVAAAVTVDDVGVAVFLTTAAASRIASRTDDLRVVAAVTLVGIALPFLPPLLSRFPPDIGSSYFAFGDLFGVVVGVLLRRTTRLAADLRAADALLAAAAGREERQRIARDVHDLVAHSLTVVVLHVGGARRVLRADPDAAERALADAERVCRESLDGIRGVVGLLRDGDDTAAVSLDLAALLDTYEAAGLPIRRHLQGSTEHLPLAARVTLYRVVQEALANAARHGDRRAVTEVRVDVDGAAARVRVDSPLHDGPTLDRPTLDRPPRGGQVDARPAGDHRRTSFGGYGLAGLHEQVAAVGGSVTSAAAGRRWVVECSIPAASASADAPAPARAIDAAVES